MQKNILLPQLELTMESVLVVNWLVKVGDQINADQPILEVESQKGIMEVPANEEGCLRKLFVKAGDTIREKAFLCVMTDTPEEAFEEPTELPGKTAVAPTPKNQLPAVSAQEPEIPEAIKAVPAARKMARELGIELTTIQGTGPGGRITIEDVKQAERGKCAQTEIGGEWTPLPPSRLALIAQMQKSLAEIPQIHLARQIDVTALTAKINGITFTHRLIQAVAAALVKHSILRTMINGQNVRIEPVSVAVAMDTPRGLVAPAIREAHTLSLAQIVTITKDLKIRAEAGALKREELTNAPFAISNLGMFGVEFFNAFVFHGQTAVLAVGRAIDNKSWFNLAVDHRIADGAGAARFLETLQHEILNFKREVK